MDAGTPLRRGIVPSALNFVAGAFFYHQGIDSNPVIKQEQGSAAARFLLAPTAAAATPGLLDGYGFNQYLNYRNLSAALFGQVEWTITNRLRLLPGLRFNYDQKDVDFDQQVYGGLQTTDPALIALKLSVLAPQAYKTDVDDTNLVRSDHGGLQDFRNGERLCDIRDRIQIRRSQPERRSYRRAGPARSFCSDCQARRRTSLRSWSENHSTSRCHRELQVFDTPVKDFQAQVVNSGVGVLRGYLANAEKVRVRGAEFDGTAKVNKNLSFYAAAALTDGRYISFPDAPPPFEETGGPQVKDISGSTLPGISKWAVSVSGEYTIPGTLLGRSGLFFGAFDSSYRSCIFLQRERLKVSGRCRVCAAQRTNRLPRGRQLDNIRLVPQSV